jgi:hypothetical protein
MKSKPRFRISKGLLGSIVALLMLALVAVPFVALADHVDYAVPVSSVSPAGKADVKTAGDGTVFVNAVAGNEAYNLYFTLNTWAEPDKQRTTYPISVPVTARKLSGTDWSGNAALSLTAGNFAGKGKTVTASYSAPGNATKNNVPVYVQFRVPTCAEISNGGQQQVKIQADTAGIAHLGNGHGIIIRFDCTASSTATPKPTNTATVVPPTPTATVVPPTPTATVVPPTPTATVVPPTPTATVTPPTPTPTPDVCYDYDGNPIACN